MFLKKKTRQVGKFRHKKKKHKKNQKKPCLVPMSESSGHPALTHHSSCLVSQKEQPQGPRNSPRTFLPTRQNLGSSLSLRWLVAPGGCCVYFPSLCFACMPRVMQQQR